MPVLLPAAGPGAAQQSWPPPGPAKQRGVPPASLPGRSLVKSPRLALLGHRSNHDARLPIDKEHYHSVPQGLERRSAPRFTNGDPAAPAKIGTDRNGVHWNEIARARQLGPLAPISPGACLRRRALLRRPRLAALHQV